MRSTPTWSTPAPTSSSADPATRWRRPEPKVSIEREVFPALVGNGLYGHEVSGYWLDIGTPERYLQATFEILEAR